MFSYSSATSITHLPDPWEGSGSPPGTYPEVDSHRGNEAAGEEGAVLEAHQQAGLADPRVTHQHHLQGEREGAREGCQAPGSGKAAPLQPLPCSITGVGSRCLRGKSTSKSKVLRLRGGWGRGWERPTVGLFPTLHHVTKLEIPSPDRHLTGPSWGHKHPLKTKRCHLGDTSLPCCPQHTHKTPHHVWGCLGG